MDDQNKQTTKQPWIRWTLWINKMSARKILSRKDNYSLNAYLGPKTSIIQWKDYFNFKDIFTFFLFLQCLIILVLKQKLFLLI